VKHGLEGIVSKHVGSPYRSGPSKTWLKMKNMVESEYELIELAPDRNGCLRAHLRRPSDASYAGVAALALTASERERLQPGLGPPVAGPGELRHAMVRAIA